MKEILRRLVWDQEGQGMAEYGLILALIAVAVIAILGTMGGQIGATFQKVVGKLQEANSQ
ncbi:MAG: pilus assembly protein Flp/PilA [Thermacetogenium sp.]|nr:pilus assembly protein Flp/PilA [Thermacetogenium sp.]